MGGSNMNYSIYRFTLDIHRTKSQVSIPVLFHDTGIQFYISLTDGGKPYFIEDGCRAVFSAKKPDGATLFNDCIIEDNTRIRYDFTEQTTNCEGMMNCEIRLYGTDGNLLTTPAFVVVVDPRVIYDSEVLDSYPEATLLDNMVSAENARLVGEQKRVDAEAVRVIVENARAAAEAERIAAENARVAAEVVRGDAETERIANEAERVAAYAHMIGSWVAYSAHEDGTDYTWTWSEGQRYIGICNGKTPPQDKTGFVWSKFVDTGIYVGSGDMPSWCDLQIDPDGDVTEIVQTPGQSTTNVMSQKAVSDSFANALAGSASGEMVVLDDVSPIAHEMAVSVRKKNLCNIASITSAEQVAGSFRLYYIKKHGTYTASADVTLYADDTATFPNFTLQVWYMDNTYTGGQYNKAIIKDGVAKRVYATVTTDSTKAIESIRIIALNCSAGYEGRNAKAENIQLEEGATATPYAPYVEDVSGAKVKVLGKNLATAQQVYEGANKYAVMEYDGRTCVRFVDNITTQKTFIPFKPNTQYTVSFDARVVYREDKSGNSGMLTFVYSDGTKTSITSGRNEAWEHFTGTSLAGKTVVSIGVVQYTYYNYCYIDINSFQLEESPIETEYEAYKEPVTYAQGEPINSIYPCTTLMTDTVGAVMDVTYNRDANKVVNELAARLAALEAAALN
jgi:hypothetical protein